MSTEDMDRFHGFLKLCSTNDFLHSTDTAQPPCKCKAYDDLSHLTVASRKVKRTGAKTCESRGRQQSIAVTGAEHTNGEGLLLLSAMVEEASEPSVLKILACADPISWRNANLERHRLPVSFSEATRSLPLPPRSHCYSTCIQCGTGKNTV